MQRQKTEHQKRATVIRRANNMVIEKQGNRTLTPALAQNIPNVEQEVNVKDRDDPAENARAFKLDKTTGT